MGHIYMDYKLLPFTGRRSALLCNKIILPYKFINRLIQAFHGLLLFRFIPVGKRVHHALVDMVLKHGLAQAVERGLHRGDLDEDIRTVPLLLHHRAYGVRVADDAGDSVDHSFIVIRRMNVVVTYFAHIAPPKAYRGRCPGSILNGWAKLGNIFHVMRYSRSVLAKFAPVLLKVHTEQETGAVENRPAG